MLKFTEILSEEKAKQEEFGKLAPDPKGKLHEVLVGYHLNNGKHMEKHPDVDGKSSKQVHDEIKKNLTPQQYKNFNQRAKKAAEHIKQNLGLTDISGVQWTSKEGDIHRATGIHSTQKEDDSDIVVTDKSGRHHGISLKVSDDNKPITLSNPGIDSTYGGEKYLEQHRKKILNDYPELQTITNAAKRKEWLRNNSDADEDIRTRNVAVLQKIAKHTHDRLSEMTPEQRAHHVRHIVLHAYSTPMQAEGHNHIRHFTGGGHDADMHISHPGSDHEHILNDHKNITTRHSGTSVYFEHKGVPFAMQTIKFSSQSDPLGSVVGAGKEVIRKKDESMRQAAKAHAETEAPVKPEEEITSKHIESNHPIIKKKLSDYRPKKSRIFTAPESEKQVSPIAKMQKPGIKTRISPSGWPEHMHQGHTDGTHGGMQF